ncbi:hypothetical protein [Fibrella aquatilis]|uniref:Uncharacterized protein n=1 Tax=Fibrella aquatilis TaxID=2817059 RepID=A0A939GDV0_9BACT|nr:hypothetical protein [Fibrella aquatilis]MBO0934593.1 hypothetical protein [Fibrella aquatilis]
MYFQKPVPPVGGGILEPLNVPDLADTTGGMIKPGGKMITVEQANKALAEMRARHEAEARLGLPMDSLAPTASQKPNYTGWLVLAGAGFGLYKLLSR